ncbi:hypothetical protein ACERK3_04045 [Phycisphaerales bacterium AB-hyl4]|uniref:Uncharacterized protein n=1 Tax=Natronomicrosphaera hydrolytica TaxID=3242702 RepID=A0ABV4U3W4_9BACT
MNSGPTAQARFWNSVAWVLAVLLLTPMAWSQVDTVTLQVEPGDVGLDGYVRPGVWTPLRLTLRNQSAEPREVICRWVVRDFDGDTVHVERRVTLTPERTQQVWLYAAPSATRAARDGWPVQVLDAETGSLLAQQRIAPRQSLESTDNLIAVMSSADLGFEPYSERYTQHEALRSLRGLTLHNLPDRWYGLSTLQAIVWTREGGEPDDARFTAAHQQALREWVRRGGHMVIVWPTVGQAWTASPLADMLPINERQVRQVQRPLPSWAGSPRTGELRPVEYATFNVSGNDGPRVDVLRRDREGDPTVVARRYGFGRVTVVGINFADRRLVQLGLPNGRFRIWHDVFHLQSPVYERDVIDAEMREGNIARPTGREAVELGRFVPGAIAMRNTAGPVLVLAIFVFGIYWLLAGPIGFVVLRQKAWLHHSWLAFLAVVVVFSVVAWGGAIVMQPRQAGIAHFSVLDLDGRTGESRTRSWLSLFVPEFGRANITLAEPDGTGRNTLANPGWRVGGPDAAGFLDPQTYTLSAGDPAQADVPMRSTAKQFTLDYFGNVGEDQPGMREPFPTPRGRLRIENAWPAGQLGHALPGTLRDVLIVYCPGADGSDQHRWMPWVWRHGDWAPGELLELGGAPTNADRLVDRRHDFDIERNWSNEGFLGQLIARRTGQRFVDLEPLQVANANEMMQAVEMLSFFSALPAPNFRAGVTTLGGRRSVGYERELGRALDLTPLIAGRRIILIGYLENSALPAPLTLNGRPLQAEGWTVVRWVYDLD